MMLKGEIKKLDASKEKTVLVLYVSDSEGKYGVINRKFFECTLKYAIWSAEPFADDYLISVITHPRLQEFGESVGVWTVKVYRVHFHGEAARGFCMFEVDNRSTDGLTVNREGDKELSKTEFETKLKTHKYKVAQEDGGQLIALKMYVH